MSRKILVASFCLVLSLCCSVLYAATNPSSGILSPSQQVLNFTGGPFPVSNPSSPVGENPPVCTDQVCGQFLLQVEIPSNDPNVYRVRFSIGWTNNGTTTTGSDASDYDIYVYEPNITGTKITQATSTSATNPEVGSFRAESGTHTYTIYAVPYDVSPTVPFNGTVSLVNATPQRPNPPPNPPLPQGTPRFFNYMTPTGIADSWGEPTIGANWITGKVMFFGGLSPYALRVSFDDCSSPAGVTWDRTPLFLDTLPRAVGGDPILFTDPQTGRTLVSQLQFGTTVSTMEFTDNDGQRYEASQGAGMGSGIDHQTVGGGPFALGLTGVGYRNAVYYCAQDIAFANCALSVDGGRTFGPAVPIYSLADCGGLHGHLKVAPDGTVYVPNKGCGSGKQGVAVSEDNGTTWTVHEIPTSTEGDTDPSVGIATDGTVYFGYEAADGHAHIAVSHDKGVTWTDDQDIGAALSIQNSVFPAVVAGDGGPNGRAAYAFFGSTTPGSYNDPDFAGEWYLILATTLDGGRTWTTQNATPNDPVQRGSICTAGINCSGNTRNLLDFFDATIDQGGRVLVGYDDGCITGGCIRGDMNGDGVYDGVNDFTAKGVIARQSGGKRMYAALDPVEPTTPAAPSVKATANTAGTIVRLSWSKPDDGGSTITAYRIYRRTSDGSFALLATVPETNFADRTTVPGTNYIYRVTAVNSHGEGPFCGEIVPETVTGAVACTEPGELVISDINNDGSDFDIVPNSPADQRVNIRQLFVAEPYLGPNINKLMFTLNVGHSTSNSAPPSSQWYIIWNRPVPDADFDRWYVAMKSDALGATSFEYGKFGVGLDATNPNPNANVPVRLGDVDQGSYNPINGVITITLSTSKAEGISAGQSLTDLNVRTFLGQPDSGTKPQRTASDITDNSSYLLIGNAACMANTPPTAVIVGKPNQGNAPLTVNLSAAGSFDDDGDAITWYKFNFGDGSPEASQASPTTSHTYSTAGNYFARVTVTDSHDAESLNDAFVGIEVREPPTTTCMEDDDSRISYSNGWHLINDPNASAGHFRLHTGDQENHFASVTFNVAEGRTGKITYFYATSQRGGSAEIFVDGVSRGTVSYQGPAGSTRAPVFGATLEIANLGPGQHTFQLKNFHHPVYVDRICLESSSSNSQPATGPGSTSTDSKNLNSGEAVTSPVNIGTNATAISVVAESMTPALIRIVLIDPAGSVVQTSDNSSGFAVIDAPVSAAGTYLITVLNLSLGPVQAWTAVTPTVSR